MSDVPCDYVAISLPPAAEKEKTGGSRIHHGETEGFKSSEFTAIFNSNFMSARLRLQSFKHFALKSATATH